MADKKEEKDPKKAEKKVFDELDEAFIGFCQLHQLDQDGIAGRTLGTSVKAPLQIISAPGADQVVMQALFPAANPLFFLELRNEEQFYMWGQWWLNGPKYSESNSFLASNPLKMQECHKMMEKNGAPKFEGHALCEFVKDYTKKPCKVEFTIEEKKFKTKMASCTVTIPKDVWMEYKSYRVRMWKTGKNWAGADKDEDDEKKEEGKKED